MLAYYWESKVLGKKYFWVWVPVLAQIWMVPNTSTKPVGLVSWGKEKKIIRQQGRYNRHKLQKYLLKPSNWQGCNKYRHIYWEDWSVQNVKTFLEKRFFIQVDIENKQTCSQFNLLFPFHNLILLVIYFTANLRYFSSAIAGSQALEYWLKYINKDTWI